MPRSRVPERWDSLTGSELRQLLSTYDALTILSAIWFMALFVRYLLPPLFPRLQTLYGVGSAETGLLLTVLMTCYALMQFPSGALSDRFGRHRVITAGTVVFSAASLLVVVADGYWFFLVAVGLIGIGTGAHKTVAIHLLSTVYPEQAGQSLGVMDTVGQFGGAIAPAIIVALLSSALDWRAAFVVAAVVGFVLTVLNNRYVAARVRDLSDERPAESGDGTTADEPAADSTATTDAEDDPDSGPSYLTAFLDPIFGAFVGVSVLYGFAWGGVTAFLPLYLIEQKAFPASTASLMYSGLFLMTLSQLVTGRISDRTGSLPTMTALLALVVGSTVVLLVSQSMVLVGTAVFLFGAGMHGFRPVRSTYLVEVIPDRVGGGTLGIVRTLIAGAGAVAPVAVGVLSDHFGYAWSFWTLGGAVAIGFVLLLVVVAAESD